MDIQFKNQVKSLQREKAITETVIDSYKEDIILNLPPRDTFFNNMKEEKVVKKNQKTLLQKLVSFFS